MRAAYPDVVQCPMFAALLLLAACVRVAPPSRTSPRPGPVAGVVHPLNLWDVEKAGKASHLFGTCHIGVALDYALPRPDDESLAKARVVYTEAAMDFESTDAIRLVWSEARLSARLSRPAFERLVLAAPDFPASIIDHFVPWAAASVPMMMTAVGPDGSFSAMDKEIQTRAKRAGIPSLHVETIEGQSAMLAAADPAFVAALEAEPDVGELEAAFRALDDLCMRGIVDEPRLVDPAAPETEALLFARNRAWMATLSPELAQGGAFVAVGAAHMFGADGLIKLLEREGYTVKRRSTTRPAQQGTTFSAPALTPTFDRALFLRVQTELGPILADLMCADGSLARTCFVADDSECRGRVQADVEICLLQQAPKLVAAGATPAITQAVAGCTAAGLALDAMVNERFAEAPMCRAMQDAMQAAGKVGG